MDQRVKENAKLSVLQFIKGQTLERNKLEFKKQWYKLNWKVQQRPGHKPIHNKDYYEFIKDCVAIVNSYGREEGLIVIGVDDETKELYNTNISDSGLDDPSLIKDIIIGNVDKAFLVDIDYIEIEGKRISLIYIPPSADKPHLIVNYWSEKQYPSKNVIWIKNGTGATIAGKGDIDRMYWERTNIILDKKIEVALNLNKLRFGYGGKEQLSFHGKIAIENIGSRKLLVSGFELSINRQGTLMKFSANLDEKPVSLAPNEPIELTEIVFSHTIALNH